MKNKEKDIQMRNRHRLTEREKKERWRKRQTIKVCIEKERNNERVTSS